MAKKSLSDQAILKRARIKAVLITLVYLILLALGFIGAYLVLFSKWFQQPPNLESFFVLSMLGQWIFILIVFSFLTTEKPWTRILYWLFFTAECLLFALPVWVFLQNGSGLIVCLTWIGFMCMKLSLLYRYGHWLSHSPTTAIVFDKTLKVSYPQPDEVVYTEKRRPIQPVSSSYEEEKSLQKNYESLSFEEVAPRIAVRFAFLIYGSLILFPILIQIFQNFFVSTDNQEVFATRLIFTMSVLTAVVWTAPIFLLYLKDRFAKKSVFICLALQVCIEIWFVFQLISIGNSASVAYGWQVYLYISLVEIARIGLLLWGLSWIFKLPVPEEEVFSTLEEEEEQIPEEWIEVDDEDFFEEYDPQQEALEKKQQREELKNKYHHLTSSLVNKAQGSLHSIKKNSHPDFSDSSDEENLK